MHEAHQDFKFHTQTGESAFWSLAQNYSLSIWKWNLVRLPLMFKWEMPLPAKPHDRLIDALPALGRVMAFYVVAGLHDTEKTCLSVCVCGALVN